MIGRNLIHWLTGPFLGLSLVGLAIHGNSGPGFFFFSVAAAIGYVAFAPLIQFFLRRTSRLRERPAAASGISLAIVTASLFIISGAAVFNQW